MSAKKSIGIMGVAVTSGNRGVWALGASLLNLANVAFPGAEPKLLISNANDHPVPFRISGQSRMVKVVHARMSPKTHLRNHLFVILMAAVCYRVTPAKSVRTRLVNWIPWLKAVEEADLVGDIRGGDSFSDIYGMKRFFRGFFEAWTVILIKGSIVQFPQTYGPYKSPVARVLARYLLRRSSTIIARDKKSRQLAQELVGGQREVLLTPDVAFCLESVRHSDVRLHPPLQGLKPPHVIGLNVNGLMYNGGYSRSNMFGLAMDYPAFLQKLLLALLRETQREVWLVPHTIAPAGDVESDNEASERLKTSLPIDLQSRVRIVDSNYDCHELKGIIANFDVFIGARMHSCIAALSQGVPCIGIAYSMKFAGVFESVDMEEWVIDGRLVANDQAVERVLELYRQRDAVRGRLSRAAEDARGQLKNVFGDLLSSFQPREGTVDVSADAIAANT
jgi:colanic acid/amylovoran biosynthesis protein